MRSNMLKNDGYTADELRNWIDSQGIGEVFNALMDDYYYGTDEDDVMNDINDLLGTNYIASDIPVV